METVFNALKAMGKATSLELAARLDINREEVVTELWELKRAGVVTKNGLSWSLSDGGELEGEDAGEASAPKVTEQHLTEAIEKHGPQTADELAALFGVTSRKVASTLAMATKKSRVHRVAKNGRYRYYLPNQRVAEMQENSKPEQQPEGVNFPAPEIASPEIAEVVQSIPSFTEKRPDDLIFPSLHLANRELRRAKSHVQKWERVCAALRELNKHREIVMQITDSSRRVASEK
ncbi:TPA: DUF1627 domain-containing protein [Salmonella enterica subsp. enterica serovar Kottbus]